MRRRDLMWLASLAAPGLCLSLPAIAARARAAHRLPEIRHADPAEGAGLLDERLGPQGCSVTWTEFPAGPQLLEAMNVGAVDFGTTGEAPPIFAQAAGAPLLYVGFEPPAPRGEAILVPEDSPVTSVADLKGRKVALNKGSNVHYLLVARSRMPGLGHRHRAGLPAAGRCPRRLRAAARSMPGRSGIPSSPPHRRRPEPAPSRTAPAWSAITSSISPQRLRGGKPEIIARSLEELAATDDWGNAATPRRSRRCSRRAWAFRPPC